MNPQGKFTSIGGQAVIEGVMMRSPHFIAVAVRKPNHRIVIKNVPYQGIASRFPLLKKPIFRGVAGLIESMVQGIDALSYSANIASVEGDERRERRGAFELRDFHVDRFGVSARHGLFVALPHFLTAVITSRPSIGLTAASPLFHLIDGALKMILLLSYVYLIAMMRDIHRVFQYHGAEHKSIYAFEAGEELTVENARKYTTLHPRCGTSFLLFLVLISILVFSIIFPLFGLTHLSENPILNHVLMICVKIVLMFPVAGLAYEFIKACACRMDNPIFRAMIWPGMILQKLTTREPDDQQLEVALASLRQVLKNEKADEREAARFGRARNRGALRNLARRGVRRRIPRNVGSPPCLECSTNSNRSKADSSKSRAVLRIPELANRPAEFRKLSQEHAGLRRNRRGVSALQEAALRDRDPTRSFSARKTLRSSAMAKEELKRLEPEFEQSKKNLQILLLPKDPNDEKNVVFEIRAGAGGDEAALFVAELFRLYQRYRRAPGLASSKFFR